MSRSRRGDADCWRRVRARPASSRSAPEGPRISSTPRSRPGGTLAPVAFDGASLRAPGSGGVLPPVLRGLVRVPVPAAAATRPAGSQAADAPKRKASSALALVRTHGAAVLGRAPPPSRSGGRAFKELGFDSLAAVELRNRLDCGHRGAPARHDRLRLSPVGRWRSHLLVQGDAAAAVSRRAIVGRSDGSRSRSSACPAAIPARLLTRGALGVGRRQAATRSAASRRSRLGSGAPLRPGPRRTRAPAMPARAASLPTRRLRREFFGIAPREALAMDPSNACCWKRAGRRSKTPASIRIAARQPDRSLRRGDVSRLRLAAGIDGRAGGLHDPASVAASSPAGSPTRSASRARR